MRPPVLTPTGLRVGARRLPVTRGRGGVTDAKREGDGATPRGVHRVVAVLYRPDRMARPAPWAIPIRPRDQWSDDPRDPRYNRLVRGSRLSHERMWRADRLYDLVVVLDWNMAPAVPGGGSAIFVHRWRRPGAPTAGCLALAPGDLRRLVRGLRPGARVVVP